jgi:hypothetical protein
VKRDLSNNENVARKNEDNVKITMELMSWLAGLEAI